MSSDRELRNRDRYIHLGIAIVALRKMRGMSQEQLAEKQRSAVHTSALLRPRVLLVHFLLMFSSILQTLWISTLPTLSAPLYFRTGYLQKRTKHNAYLLK